MAAARAAVVMAVGLAEEVRAVAKVVEATAAVFLVFLVFLVRHDIPMRVVLNTWAFAAIGCSQGDHSIGCAA